MPKAASKADLTSLREFATPRQLQYLEAVIKYGTHRKAAKGMGANPRRIDDAMSRLKKVAALRGHSPSHDMLHTVPPGFTVKGVSTYYNKDGDKAGQWVKSKTDEDARYQIALEAWGAMSDDLPRLAPLNPPALVNDQLATLYTLTDSHVGALCWHKEGGDDWDLSIAEKTLIGCFEALQASAPASRVGIVAQLGDFLHMDSIVPVTPGHGHILDADSRFSKVVTVALRILRRVVDLALMKHEQVVVLMAEGNHDISSSIWLRIMFMALYEKEPRVTVIDSPLPYYAYQHGKTMLAWHHGHLTKTNQLPILFAAQFPKMWGATEKRYAHTGHKHHVEEREHSGIIVIQHPTLAARDAYAARGGWIAERQATAITYHKEFGQVARNTVVPEMLELPGPQA